MDRRSLLGGLASAAVPVQALTLDRKKDILFRFDTGDNTGLSAPQAGAFLFSEVAGYYMTDMHFGHPSIFWNILLKGMGQTHFMDHANFQRFERDYLAWIDGL